MPSHTGLSRLGRARPCTALTIALGLATPAACSAPATSSTSDTGFDDTSVDTTGTSTSSDGSTSSDASWTEADSTTGAGDPTDIELCEAGCAWEVGCEPDYALEQCLDDCLYNLSVFDLAPECDEAMSTVTACLAQLATCTPELDDLPPGCADAQQAAADCDLQYSCVASFDLPLEQSSCAAVEECNLLDPTVRQMQCDERSCTCLEDGEVTGQCESAGFCASVEPKNPWAFDDRVVPFVERCCGWSGYGEPPVPGA